MRLPFAWPPSQICVYFLLRSVCIHQPALAEVVVVVVPCRQNQILTDLDIHKIKSARGDAGICNTQPAPSPWSMAVLEPCQQGSSFNA